MAAEDWVLDTGADGPALSRYIPSEIRERDSRTLVMSFDQPIATAISFRPGERRDCLTRQATSARPNSPGAYPAALGID